MIKEEVKYDVKEEVKEEVNVPHAWSRLNHIGEVVIVVAMYAAP